MTLIGHSNIDLWLLTTKSNQIALRGVENISAKCEDTATSTFEPIKKLRLTSGPCERYAVYFLGYCAHRSKMDE